MLNDMRTQLSLIQLERCRSMNCRLPCVSIDVSKVMSNARLVKQICETYRISPVVVTKGIGADRHLIKNLINIGFTSFADSRLINIAAIQSCFRNVHCRMLRIPGPSEAEEVIQHCDSSLNSELTTIMALSRAAVARKKIHQIILMMEGGDGREGIHPTELDRYVSFIYNLKGVELAGIGTNYGCYGNYKPNEHDFMEMSRLVTKMETKWRKKVPILSGGNSSLLPFLHEGANMGRINELRIGESIFLGTNTRDGGHLPGFFHDAFTVEAEVLEWRNKRSNCIQAIVGIGQQDIDWRSLHPKNENMKILGSSSDHLVMDVTQTEPLSIGQRISFCLDYHGLLRAMTTPYLFKHYVYDPVLSLRSNRRGES